MKVMGNDLGMCGIEQLIHAGEIAYDTDDIGDGIAIFAVPHDCIITRVVAVVKTAFAGATSPVLIYGTKDDDDAFLAAGDVTEGTAGAYTKDHFTEMEAGDEIYCKLTGTGTFSAGAADLYIFAVGIPEVIS